MNTQIFNLVASVKTEIRVLYSTKRVEFKTGASLRLKFPMFHIIKSFKIKKNKVKNQMAKNYICYESKDKQFITQIGFKKISEYLYVQNLIRDEDGEIIEDSIELAVDNNEIRALRDFLNSLNLKDHEGEDI